MVYPRVSLYAFMLAAAGIPLYIHLPRFAAVELGLGLGALGGILLAIRLIDLVQDPAIGWAIDRWPGAQAGFATAAAAGLALGFPLLFSLPSGVAPLTLVAVLVLLFTAYSLGSILLYGRSATLAARPTAPELMTLAAWREGGMLAGVVVAAALPALLVGLGASGTGYAAFGTALGLVAIIAGIVTLPIWQRRPLSGASLSLSGLAGSGGGRLLALALVNALPVAVTSTLFLFFVEDRLALPGKAGPLLILFFLCAGASVPGWTALARRIGARQVLILSMPLAIAAFLGAAALAPGQLWAFALICMASGAALGADMVVLPAMFSVALTRAGLNAGAAFGLWSFAGKLGLALAAFLTLPLLEHVGFVPGQGNDTRALAALNAAYAILPCLLKLGAFALVLTLPSKEA